jgi:glutamyl-tRNA synthetase
MNILTRFAPSPTGLLHIGSARAALVPYLFARSHGGKFMLRIDDTDIERSREEYTLQIQEDLKWLGLEWEVFSKQSQRMERYNEIKQQLFVSGRLYPCYESATELDIKRKMQLTRGQPPIYDRAGLKLTEQQISQFESEGKKPHWRFKLDEASIIEWNDLIKGRIKFEAHNLSDPILIRENGAPTYMLPSAIDDMDFNVSHIVRGEDHVTNTAIQIQIFQAMGNYMPQFAHHSLFKGREGKISKREGGFDIMALKGQGIEAMAINSFLARLGTSEPTVPEVHLHDLVKAFDISKFSKTAAIYEFADLERLNQKVLHLMNYSDVKDRQEMRGVSEEFWLAVRQNLSHLGEISQWLEICNSNLTPIIEDAGFLQQAAGVLPPEPWDAGTWGVWIEKIKQISPRKGKDLFMPLRKALTAREAGPELKIVLPLIGREKVLARLTSDI